MGESKAFKIFLVIFSAVVSLVIGIAGTKFADTLFLRDDFVFELTNSEPFIANNQSVQITRLVTENTGKKIIEDVDITLDPKGRNVEYQIYGVTKELVKVAQPLNPFNAKLAYLNPGERLIIQFLFRAATNAPNLGDSLSPVVRSKGGLGVPKAVAQKDSINYFSIAPAVASMILFAVMLPFLLRVLQDSVHPRNVMSLLYNKYRFDENFKRMIVSSEDDIKYILESEFLTSEVATASKDQILSAIALQEELINMKRIHPASVLVIKINIAKLYLKLGEDQKAKAVVKNINPSKYQVAGLKIEAEADVKRLID